ncbi:Flotillin-like protein 3 [Nymphaea thermarum]|nr:Flotillin-like protein 3 [Nymphaea thermarum]
MTVETETKMMAADSRYYQEKRDVEAQFYERELEAHGRSAVAEMCNRQHEANAELYAKQIGVRGHGCYYMAQRDYLMINEGVYEEIVWATGHLGPRIIIKRAVSGRSWDLTSETTGRFGSGRLRAELLSKMTVEPETKMMAADSRYYQEKRNAKAQLYERELEAHGRSVLAEMHNRQQEADAEFYAKQKASEAMVEAANAGAYYVEKMLNALGGCYMAQKDYLMINEGVYQEIAWATGRLGLGPRCGLGSPVPDQFHN